HNLLLAGVVVGAMFGSLLMFLVSISTTNMLRDIIGWLLGNLEVAHWSDNYAVTVVVVLGVGLAMAFRRDLNVMLLGEEPAAHLGLRVERMKKFFFVLGSLVTAAAVATCGIIGFVGLIVPHVMRMILGADHRYLVPGAALAGALFLIVADAFARNIMRLTPLGAVVIPIGVVTALLGGPFFLYLLRRRGKGYWN
ncbi:MAG: iron chelate uptake ABC transporter family permease subunit, partial [Bradyrhizobium sp.]|nr:iron chelate uptake ABC transporter family permease subunit [Bradyrhizobium sp.]